MIPEFAYSLYQNFEREGIPLLLAGGWAVSYHGYPRTTLDVDWVCSRSLQAKAEELMQRLGFDKAADGMASRFRRANDLSFPFIDLIWVDDVSFSKMAEADIERKDSSPVPVISFRALLSMKLFAMKDQEERDWKDFLDIRSLLRRSPGKIPEDELKALCDKFAGPDAYQKIRGSGL
ncbi:MAG: hypothetical protein JWO82_217 [Akkermansiaceae bacterium]|nr:hypothetical protein [Akkermansiaceae bacterium]